MKSEDDDILAADPSMSKQDLINLKKRREKEKLAKQKQDLEKQEYDDAFESKYSSESKLNL